MGWDGIPTRLFCSPKYLGTKCRTICTLFPHPNFMQGHLGAPKPFSQYTSPMNIAEQLSWAITHIHPKNASRIANLIYDSTKETNESIRVLIQDPTRLKQKIDEAVAILERNGN